MFPSLADSELVGVYQRDQPHWLDNLIWLYRFRRILEFPRWWCFLLWQSLCFFPMIQIQCHVHVISNISSKTNIVAFLGSHILNLTWCLGFFITKFWETMILAVGGCGSCLILQEWGCPMLVLSIHVRWWHYDLLRLADGILWLYWLNCHARCSWLCTDPETHHTAFKFPFVKLWQTEIFNFSSDDT